ncbi:MAG TPA: translocation/assembly module TamB domain-containing protein [Marinilabiliaceae bacterium]|nr:translocation/assembly module TamB domain-containing protein [Marinilabiliaceae bacterium]
MMKIVRKIALGIVTALFLIIAGAFVLMQTTWFKNFIKDELLKIAHENIYGTVVLDKLSGNFFTHIELSGLTLLDEEKDTLLSLDKLSIEYSPLELISGRVVVDRIYLNSPRGYLKQGADSLWNFQNILRPIEADTTEKKSSKTKLTFWLHRLRIKSGNLFIQTPDTIIPKTIENLNLSLSGLYTSKKMMAHVKELSFISQQPHLELKKLQFNIKTDFTQWWVSNFELTTTQNNIKLNGNYGSLENFEVLLDWDKVVLEEFNSFIPPLPISASPDLKFSAKSKNKQTLFELVLNSKDESIEIEGEIQQLSNLLQESLRSATLLDLDLSMKGVVPHHWIKMDALPLVINADFDIKGNGLPGASEPLTLKGKLYETLWEGHKIDSGTIEGSYNNGQTHADVRLLAAFGKVNATANLNLNNSAEDYSLKLSTQKLALHQLLTGKVDSTVVSLDLTATGNGIGTDQLSANFSGFMSNSVIEYIPVDTLQFQGSYQNRRLLLDTLTINNESLKGFAHGYYEIDGQLQGNVDMELDNALAFAHYFNQPTQWQKLNLQATANGTVDSLSFNTNVQLNSLVMDTTLNIQDLSLVAKGNLIDQKPYINAELISSNIKSGTILAEDLKLNAQLNDTLWDVDLKSNMMDDMKISLEASGNLGKLILVTLSKLDLETEYNHLHLEDPTYITYGDSIIQIEKLHIVDRRDTSFLVSMDAFYNQKDSIRLTGDFASLNLEALHNYGLMKESMAGRVDLKINLEGYKNNINLTGKTSLKEFVVEPLAFKNIGVNFNYPGDSLRVVAAMYSEEGDSITLKGSIPLQVVFQDSLQISWNKSFKAALLSQNAPLKNFLMDLEGFDQPEALMNIDIKGSGTTSDPQIKGYINIDKGILPLPQYGINYKDILLRLSVDGNKINMDSLYIRQKGYLLASGIIEMKESIASGKIESSNLAIKARDFYVSQHRNYEIQINSDLSFHDKQGTSKFGGNIKVLRSSFNIDALTEMGGSTRKLEEPLLIQALKEGKTINTDSTVTLKDTITLKKELPKAPSFMKHLTGSLKLEFPRNTWLKSDDMQIEVYGNLDVVKNSSFFELFGSLGVHRGFYTFYGKKMVIEEGEFIFTGSEEFDPILNVKANYTFRSAEREKRVLTLLVTGKLSDPDIRFELERLEIPEADAIAYILFGQPFDQLNHGGQEGVSDAMSTRLLSNLVASQLSKTLGKTLNLDMIEIDASDNWQNTTFMVGKYITNDLFVTYQRSFGESDENEITPETITLEYEITKRLSVRLLQGKVKESGIDLIIKLEK